MAYRVMNRLTKSLTLQVRFVFQTPSTSRRLQGIENEGMDYDRVLGLPQSSIPLQFILSKSNSYLQKRGLLWSFLGLKMSVNSMGGVLWATVHVSEGRRLKFQCKRQKFPEDSGKKRFYMSRCKAKVCGGSFPVLSGPALLTAANLALWSAHAASKIVNWCRKGTGTVNGLQFI